MFYFMLGVIVGIALMLLAAYIAYQESKKDLRFDYDIGYKDGHDDGYQEGLNDARWKGESDGRDDEH